jgi:hypothetical protein
MDQQTQTALASLQQQIATLAARGNGSPDVYAPGSGMSYIEPGPRDWYSYQTGFQSLASGVSITGSIAIEADSNFYLNAITYQADVAGAAITQDSNPVPLVTLLLVDSGSSRQLMSAAVPLGAIAGTGTLPYRLPKPRLFMRTSSINWTLANYSAATTYHLNVILHGFKVYNIR